MTRAVGREIDMPGTDDWYERRLVEETGKLRVEAAAAETRLVDRIATAEVALRHDMAAMEVRLVDRISVTESGLRKEIGSVEGTLRQEISGLAVTLRGEMGSFRADMIKWSFLFWIGQVAAMAAILSAVLR